MRDYSIDDGRNLVHAARTAIELKLRSPNFNPKMVEKSIEGYDEKIGVYVTLEHYPTMSLRGHYGFVHPTDKLSKNLVESALSAAMGHKSFVSISEKELDETVVQVSILSQPEEIKKNSAIAKKNQIVIGRDGVMVQYGFRNGILLPYVALKFNWSRERFLTESCISAGLDPNMWKRPDVSVYKFTAQTFRESSPEGEVIRE